MARCLTTWTIERPNDEGGDAPDLVGHGWAAGCDVCQEVCPWNRFATPTTDARFDPRPGLDAITPERIPDDAELVGSPLARVGADGLRRTVARALAVSTRSEGEP